MKIKTDIDILDMLSEVGSFAFDNCSYDISDEQADMLRNNDIDFNCE